MSLKRQYTNQILCIYPQVPFSSLITITVNDEERVPHTHSNANLIIQQNKMKIFEISTVNNVKILNNHRLFFHFGVCT
jgi:capsular polysaccharide biosynthesis protein